MMCNNPARPLPVGKIPLRLLSEQISRLGAPGERVRIGPRLGDDATAIDMGDRYLVCAADPVTLASERIGRYAVHINANDVAVMGARPAWFWAILLLPEGKSDAALVDSVFADIREACAALGVALCGGHSEVTAGLGRPLVGGFMAGEAGREELVDKTRIRPGDDIILVRGIAIEGTATIAAERPGMLGGLDPEMVSRARRLFTDPGISVVDEALRAAKSGRVHGMHDPTEGGLWGGLRELAEVASAGLAVERERIPVLPETAAVCGALDLDPGGLLASGSLLVVVEPGAAVSMVESCASRGTRASVIGRVEEKGFGVRVKEGGDYLPMPEVERDEITKVIS